MENFVCDSCGELVVGNGYTDHCPECLVGKHMDLLIPGDRASDCQGLMVPVGYVIKNGEEKIVYKCQGCNHEFVVRTGPNDNREAILRVVVASNYGK